MHFSTTQFVVLCYDSPTVGEYLTSAPLPTGMRLVTK
jgi:hypothetical protein